MNATMDQEKPAMASLITPPSENNEVFANINQNNLFLSVPATPPAEDSKDEGANDLEPMTFNFDGPQSNHGNQNEFPQASSSLNARSQSVSSSRHDSPEEPITFNFGPQYLAAPETSFIASLTSGRSLKKIHVPLGIRELAASLNNRRRAATNREFRGGASAYIDEDESGTYDPKKERRTPSPSRPTKRIKTSSVDDEDGTSKPRRPTKQIGFRYSLVVKLQLNSKKGLDYLSSIPAGPSFIASHYRSESGTSDEEYDSDDASHVVKSKRKRNIKPPTRLGATYSRSDGLTIASLTAGHPQRRGCKCCFEQDNDDCSLIEHPDEFPCEACDDAGDDCVFIIPPTYKKSCLRCQDKRRNCSYVLDGGKGIEKCDACAEEGIVCCAEPMTEKNVVRRFAKLPIRRKVKPKPISEVGSEGNKAVRERRYIACNQCRYLKPGKSSCTNRGNADYGPCAPCRKSGQTCEFIDKKTGHPFQLPNTSSSNTVPKPSFGRKLSSFSDKYSHSDASTHDRNPLGTPHSPNSLTAILYSEIERKSSRKAAKLRAKGKLLSPASKKYRSKHLTSPKLIGRTLGLSHITITTAFCHPITFNYIPDPLNTHPCSWCDNPFFGLWGLASDNPPRKVEGYYLPASEGGGFEEVYSGYADLGYKRSVMCVRCTYARVRITMCQSHILRALSVGKEGEAEVDIRVLDDMEWSKAAEAEALRQGDEVAGSLVREAKWCSVCPSLAALKCCAEQLFDENGEPVQHRKDGWGLGERGDGCDLLLCEDCAKLMGKLIQGGARTGAKQLDAMVREVKRNHWRYTDGVRADAEFLTSGGELLRRMAGGSGGAGVGGGRKLEGVNREEKWIGEDPWEGISGGEPVKKRKREIKGWMGDRDLDRKHDWKGKGRARSEVDEDDELLSTFRAREERYSRSSMSIDSKGKGRMGLKSSSGGSKVNKEITGREQYSYGIPRLGSSSFSASASTSFGSTASTTSSSSRHHHQAQEKDRQSSQQSNANIPQRLHQSRSNMKEENRSMAHPPSFTHANTWNGVGNLSMASSRGMKRKRDVDRDGRVYLEDQ